MSYAHDVCRLRLSTDHFTLLQQKDKLTMMHWIWTILIGFVAGFVARAITPGKSVTGFIMTAVLGVAGSVLASFIGQSLGWYRAGEVTGFIGSVIGAVILLVIYGLVTRNNN